MDAEGALTELVAFGPTKWVEHVAAHPAGVRAVASGRTVVLFDTQGNRLKTLGHPSSVGGLAFDAKGKRLAAKPLQWRLPLVRGGEGGLVRALLEWKGSHHAVLFDPGRGHVITAVQEALAARLAADGRAAHAHVRLSGQDERSLSLFRPRPLAGHLGGGIRRAVAVLRRRADGQGTARDRRRRRRAVHRRRLPSATGGGGGADFADGLVLISDIASGRVVPIVPPGRRPCLGAGVERPPARISPSAPGNRLRCHRRFVETGLTSRLSETAADSHPRIVTPRLAHAKLGLGTYGLVGAEGSGRWVGARPRLPASGHRRDVRQRGGSWARRSAPAACLRRGTVRHHQGVVDQSCPRCDSRRLRGLSRPSRARLCRFVPHPLAGTGDGSARRACTLSALLAEGRTRAIGVCNFPLACCVPPWPPAPPSPRCRWNAIALLDQSALLALCRQNGLVLTAYSAARQGASGGGTGAAAHRRQARGQRGAGRPRLAGAARRGGGHSQGAAAGGQRANLAALDLTLDEADRLPSPPCRRTGASSIPPSPPTGRPDTPLTAARRRPTSSLAAAAEECGHGARRGRAEVDLGISLETVATVIDHARSRAVRRRRCRAL